MKNCTAIIINFLREPYLFECLDSLKAKYPDIKILVGENGKYTEKKKKQIESYKNTKYVKVGWDAGVCKARNKLVSMVKTKYVLIGDDDFKYNEKSDIESMAKFLDNNNDIDLIAGRIVESGVLKNYQAYVHKYDDHFEYEPLELNNFKKCSESGLQYKECDLAFNFFVARTEAVKDTLWDEKIKVAFEHSSFFIDFKDKGYKVAFTPDITVIHKPQIKEKLKNKKSYTNFRRRRSDKKRFFERFNISYVKGINGQKNYYDHTSMSEITFCITMFERWEKLENLLFSIAKYYSTANIMIADQSKKFKAKDYLDLYQRLYEAGLKNKPHTINMPYDCGLSACRNKLVGLARTKYALILEEDFEFTEDTKIKLMLEYLKENYDYVGVGGQVYENNQLVEFSHFYSKKGKTLRMKKNDKKFIKGFRDTEGIMNFALFRRSVFNVVRWDTDIKINGEHTSFLLELKKNKLKIAETNKSLIAHKKGGDERSYKDMRKRDEYLKIMMDKHKIRKLIYPNNFTISLDGGIIKKGKSKN